MGEIVFLGTGGARVMMARQLLSTAGIWLNLDRTNIYLDPGPGALVHSLARGLDPALLDGIILSHRHLDHCGDVNAIIEAMTDGGLRQQGYLFAPETALVDDPVVLKYPRSYLNGLVTVKEKKCYRVGDIVFYTSMPHQHGVETYGMIFEGTEHLISYIPDTQYFPELKQFYRGDIIIISMLREEPHPRIFHLAISQVEELIGEFRPKLTILTHFGLQLYRANPRQVALEMSRRTNLKVIAAQDGDRFPI